jgi:hypothetical protein
MKKNATVTLMDIDAFPCYVWGVNI